MGRGLARGPRVLGTPGPLIGVYSFNRGSQPDQREKPPIVTVTPPVPNRATGPIRSDGVPARAPLAEQLNRFAYDPDIARTASGVLTDRDHARLPADASGASTVKCWLAGVPVVGIASQVEVVLFQICPDGLKYATATGVELVTVISPAMPIAPCKGPYVIQDGAMPPDPLPPSGSAETSATSRCTPP